MYLLLYQEMLSLTYSFNAFNQIYLFHTRILSLMAESADPLVNPMSSWQLALAAHRNWSFPAKLLSIWNNYELGTVFVFYNWTVVVNRSPFQQLFMAWMVTIHQKLLHIFTPVQILMVQQQKSPKVKIGGRGKKYAETLVYIYIYTYMYLSTAYIVTPFQKKSNNKKETKRIMCVFKRNSDTFGRNGLNPNSQSYHHHRQSMASM